MYHQHHGSIFTAPQPGIDAVAAVVADQPLEPIGTVITLVQCRLLGVQPVQLPHQVMHTAMVVIIEQIPVQLGVMTPFPPLAELAAHEQQFLAGVAPHE